MLLRELEGYRPVDINVISSRGGLGDQIARVPAIRRIAELYPHVNVCLSIPGYIKPLFEELFKGYSTIRLFNWDSERDPTNRPTYVFNEDLHTTLGCHLVDYAFHILHDRAYVSDNERNYPVITGEPEIALNTKYVVLTPGYTAPNRALHPHTWNYIAQEVERMGYEVVWLGKKDVYVDLKGRFTDGVDYDVGLNLVDKTSLLEAARVMSRASAVIGLDNGLLHLAACTPVRLVAGYSSVNPLIRLPTRDGIMGKNVWAVTPDTCRACESKVRFEFDVDFKYCYFADYRCLDELSGSKFISALKEALNAEEKMEDTDAIRRRVHLERSYAL